MLIFEILIDEAGCFYEKNSATDCFSDKILNGKILNIKCSKMLKVNFSSKKFAREAEDNRILSPIRILFKQTASANTN